MAPKARFFRLFRAPAKDVYDVIIPIYFMSKILGLAPFTLHRNEREIEKKCRPGGIGLGLLRIVGIVGSMIFVGIIIERSGMKKDVSGMARRAEVYLGTILTCTVLIMAVTRQRTLIAALARIQRLDARLERVDVPVSYDNSQVFVTWQIIGIFCVFSSKAILQSFNSDLFVFVYGVFNVVDFLNTIMLFQFVDSLCYVRQRFKWINAKLERLSADFDERARRDLFGRAHAAPVRDGKRDGRLHNFRGLVKVNPAPAARPRGDDDDVADTIVEIGRIHDLLCDVCKSLNSTYAIQILASLSVRFIMTTAQMINMYKILMGDLSKNMVTFALGLIYLFLHTSKIFMVCSICAITEEQARKTGQVLHKMWNAPPEVKLHVKHFSLQMVHQNVKLTAAGFFDIDYTLVYNIVGAVTTYLVILIQFDITKMYAEKAQQGNSSSTTNLTLGVENITSVIIDAAVNYSSDAT